MHPFNTSVLLPLRIWRLPDCILRRRLRLLRIFLAGIFRLHFELQSVDGADTHA